MCVYCCAEARPPGRLGHHHSSGRCPDTAGFPCQLPANFCLAPGPLPCPSSPWPLAKLLGNKSRGRGQCIVLSEFASGSSLLRPPSPTRPSLLARSGGAGECRPSWPTAAPGKEFASGPSLFASSQKGDGLAWMDYPAARPSQGGPAGGKLLL